MVTGHEEGEISTSVHERETEVGQQEGLQQKKETSKGRKSRTAKWNELLQQQSMINISIHKCTLKNIYLQLQQVFKVLKPH